MYMHKRSLRDEKKAEYIFLANVFNAQQHNEKANSLLASDDIIRAAKKGLIDKHVYALGGVTIENIKIAKELGFGGVVICEDLWNKFDIHNELDYKDLINHFEKLRKAVS